MNYKFLIDLVNSNDLFSPEKKVIILGYINYCKSQNIKPQETFDKMLLAYEEIKEVY